MQDDWRPEEHVHYVLTGILGVDTIYHSKGDRIKYVYRWICHAASDVERWQVQNYKLELYNPYSGERKDITGRLKEELEGRI